MIKEHKMNGKKQLTITTKNNDINKLCDRVTHHIDIARSNVQRSIDTEMVNAYFHIGKEIIEEEQKGASRAEYGSFILKELSQKLSSKYGKGFGITTLKDMRQFYLVYADQISHALRG